MPKGYKVRNCQLQLKIYISGIFFAVLLLCATIGQTIILSQYFYRMYLVGIWVRAAVTSAIYRKALRVSQASKKEVTTGEVVNLMSVDVQRLVDMMVTFITVM